MLELLLTLFIYGDGDNINITNDYINNSIYSLIHHVCYAKWLVSTSGSIHCEGQGYKFNVSRGILILYDLTDLYMYVMCNVTMQKSLL